MIHVKPGGKSSRLTWDLFSPTNHEDQLLVCQVGKRHHHAGLGEGLLQVLHHVNLWGLRLHDARDELFWTHGRRVFLLSQGSERGERKLNGGEALCPGANTDPYQTPRLEASTTVPGSSIAAAFTPHTWKIKEATSAQAD